MNFEQIKQKDETYIMNTYARFPVAIKNGHGAKLYDYDGKEYIDFASGIGVSALGTGNEAWLAAVTEQAKQLAHVSNLFYTVPALETAERLCHLSGMERVFFANSGAEANEGAIKLARKYSHDKYGKGRHMIVTLNSSFHGRTITTLAATGQEHFHQHFFPFTEGFTHIDANDFEALELALEGVGVCALMIEIVQGEGGVLPLNASYVQRARAYCNQRDILLITDEVQCGLGRTGKAFAYQHYGIQPDIVTVAKGLGGGLPIGAVLAAETCKDVLTPGTHGSTFGANPICCAAANVVLKQLEDQAFLDQVLAKGEYIKEKLLAAGCGKIKGISGLGLMLGIQVAEGTQREIVNRAVEKGLLVITAGKDRVRLLPPLTISYEEIDQGIKILLEAMG